LKSHYIYEQFDILLANNKFKSSCLKYSKSKFTNTKICHMDDSIHRGRDHFSKYRKFLIFIAKQLKILPNSFRIKLFRHCRQIQGVKGLAIRYIILKSCIKNCGNNVSIHPQVFLFSIDKLTIGNNVSIHPMSYIDATGEIEIGNDVSIAHGVTIMSTNHRFDNLDIPIKDQGTDKIKTIIKDNVWIGAKATILAGITINSGAIIAAGAVVTKSVESNMIVAGIPAKNIKYRGI
jgi:acetyltransferase-like isoleucine patch superfamily enzyme